MDGLCDAVICWWVGLRPKIKAGGVVQTGTWEPEFTSIENAVNERFSRHAASRLLCNVVSFSVPRKMGKYY